MSTNRLNGSEDADMAELADDGEKVVTMMDVLQEQQEFEDDANAVLGASDEKECTYSKGYIKRQAIYACLTCCTEAKTDPSKRAGVCLACSLNCHENHELVELYTKRNFKCDCGNPKFSTHPCQYITTKTDLNEDNNYNQNFSGLYCTCHRPYPDPEATAEDEMIQCIICEDWLHTSHLEATVPAQDQYSEMICKGCMDKNVFLHDYSNYAVNVETGDIDITSVNGIDASKTEKVCDSITDENQLPSGKTDDEQSSTKAEETINDTDMTEEKRTEPETSQSSEENKVEETIQSDLTKENDKREESEIIPIEATEEKVPETENKEKNESVEETTNVSNVVDENIKTSVETTKTADEIAELEMEKSLLEEDKSTDDCEKDENIEPKSENEKNNKTTDDDKPQSPANTTESDNKSSEITSQNDEPDKNEDATVDSSKDDKMEEDSIPVQDPVTSQEQDITTSTEKTVDSATDQVKELPCKETTEISEKPVENSVCEESLASGDDAAKETPEGISKSADDSEMKDTASLPTSESLKPDEQSHNEDTKQNDESNVVPEDKSSLESDSEKQVTEDSVKDQTESEDPSIDTDKGTMENMDVIKTSNDNEANAEPAKDSTDDLSKASEESDAKKDESMETDTKPTETVMDSETGETVATASENKEQTTSTNENKRKLSTEDVDDISVKKSKVEEQKKCVRPCGVKKVHRGATFWPSNFRQKLCTCNECLSMYKDLSVLFLIDPEDTVSAYEMLGQERINGGPATQYERGLEALSSLDRIQQINALTEYNKMRDKLLDFLKSFKDRREIVKEEDIKAFFAGMKPKREPDGVYFCR